MFFDKTNIEKELFSSGRKGILCWQPHSLADASMYENAYV
jgi:hypothetical protein